MLRSGKEACQEEGSEEGSEEKEVII